MQYAEVDFIIFATWTPDVTFPGAGCFLQEQLGGGTIGALDIRAQCAGFLFGLNIADQFVRSGVYRRILVAAAEVQSPALDYSGSGSRVASLFGDGAAVAVVGPSGGESRVASIAVHADGRRHREFWCEYPASRQHPTRFTKADFEAGRHYPSIDFEAVRRFGVESLPAVVGEALDLAQLGVSDVDHFILAHLLPDVSEDVARLLALPSSRTTVAGIQHGHLGAASLPVALSEKIEEGILGQGATVCLATCGAGFAWGAAIVKL